MTKEALVQMLNDEINVGLKTALTRVNALVAENKALKEALAQPEQEPPSEWAGIKAILDEYGLQAIDFVADFKAALAQPEQEPEVVSKVKFNRLQDDYNDLFNRALQDAKHAKAWRAHVNNCQLQGVDLDHVFKPPLTAQPEQEPVGYDYRIKYDRGCYKCCSQFCPGNCIDTSPPKRPWVGLTDDEVEDCMEMSIQKTCRAVEAKLKEKNT